MKHKKKTKRNENYAARFREHSEMVEWYESFSFFAFFFCCYCHSMALLLDFYFAFEHHLNDIPFPSYIISDEFNGPNYFVRKICALTIAHGTHAIFSHLTKMFSFSTSFVLHINEHCLKFRAIPQPSPVIENVYIQCKMCTKWCKLIILTLLTSYFNVVLARLNWAELIWAELSWPGLCVVCMWFLLGNKIKSINSLNLSKELQIYHRNRIFKNDVCS